MPDFFGVRVSERPSSITAPVTAATATMAFGTAPVHRTAGPVNQIFLATSYADAVKKLGYSDNWDKYTLCEVIYSHFQLYAAAPLLLVNVLDPAQHKTAVAGQTVPVSNRQAVLTDDVIPSSIVVKASSPTETAAVLDEDYAVLFDGDSCIIELLDDGDLAELNSIYVSYDKTNFTLSELKNNLIGGYNAAAGQSTGLELADHAYFQTKVLPDILIAPGFSHYSDVAATLAAKANSLSAVFRSFAICDLPAAAAQTAPQTAAVNSKSASGSFQNTKQAVCWPNLKLGDKTFHFSTHLAGLLASLAASHEGIPSEPPSNKTIRADAAVLDDGTQISLDLTQANLLRGQGIVTTLNFVNGFTSWGAYCACTPSNSDPKDMYINVARMVNYIANTCVLTYWQYIDRKMTRRLASSIADTLNIWLNGLTSSDHLLGGRCELRADENPTTDLAAGIIRPHFYLGLPGPVQSIDFIVEYDASYLAGIFS